MRPSKGCSGVALLLIFVFKFVSIGTNDTVIRKAKRSGKCQSVPITNYCPFFVPISVGCRRKLWPVFAGGTLLFAFYPLEDLTDCIYCL